MTRKDQQWKALRYRTEIDGVTYFIQKGSSRYARWYVLDASGKYLSKGADSMETALVQARTIHEESASGDHT